MRSGRREEGKKGRREEGKKGWQKGGEGKKFEVSVVIKKRGWGVVRKVADAFVLVNAFDNGGG
ncbi:hypothetical protein [Planctopirus limnophila]|uniref:hypothetical protein n=1 Tax=Planctopirus limnophila TaxID=120 RepID=UPI0001A2FD2B|nr:hypothetical protein [Planctopirus limnophila]